MNNIYQEDLLATFPPIDLSLVTYNSARYLNLFFESLVQQEYPTQQIAVIMTDHESSDDTWQICQSIKSQYQSQFRAFNLFRRSNQGFGAGHNHNFLQGDSDWVLVSNVDLTFEIDAITQVMIMAQQDESQVASWELRQKPYEHPKHYHPVTLETTWSSHACVLMRRQAIQSIGGYEEKIFLYGEDVELSYRLRSQGYKLRYCPQSVCYHDTYQYANQVKPQQFCGSILANSYLRLRYGSLLQIAKIPWLYFRLFFSKPLIPNQKIEVLKICFKLLSNALYFLTSRGDRNYYYPFRGWDYEFVKEGAFYVCQSSPPQKPLVSVIIRTYQKRLGFLQESVQSVLNQTYPNIEIVVVEDGSNTAEDYLTQLRSQKQIAYYPAPKGGRCVAGNLGLSKAKGDYLIFLDDDDLFYADHIEVLVNELLTKPEYAAAYSVAWEVETNIIQHEPIKYREYYYLTAFKQAFSRALLWHRNYIPIQSILFKRELYDYYGGFDLELDALEDWNLWCRYSLKNDFLFIPKTTSLYRVPYEKTISQNRHEILNSYYDKVLEKHRDLDVLLTPYDVLQYHNELREDETLGILSKPATNSFFDSYPIGKKLYRFLVNIRKKIKEKKIKIYHPFS